MRFALTSIVDGVSQTLAWADRADTDDDGDGYVLVGSEHLIARCDRMVLLGREVGSGTQRRPADLTTPHAAYQTMVAVLREHGGVHGPIDFAGTDDDGLPMTFMPAPESEQDADLRY